MLEIDRIRMGKYYSRLRKAWNSAQVKVAAYCRAGTVMLEFLAEATTKRMDHKKKKKNQ